MRNRRRIQRRGPLIVYSKNEGIRRAFRNIPGVDLVNVSKLDLLKVAPGGHVGRFVIWTESAFKTLNALYGSWDKPSQLKKGYNLPQPKMANTDLTRLMKAEEILNVLRKPKKGVRRAVKKLNPLTNTRAMLKLNPFAAILKKEGILLAQKKIRERRAALSEKRTKDRAKVLAEKRGIAKDAAKADTKKGKGKKTTVKVVKPPQTKAQIARGANIKKARLLRKERLAKQGKITPKFVKIIKERTSTIKAARMKAKREKAEKTKRRWEKLEKIKKIKVAMEKKSMGKLDENEKIPPLPKSKRVKKRIVNKMTPKAIALRDKIAKAKAFARKVRLARSLKLIKLKEKVKEAGLKQKAEAKALNAKRKAEAAAKKKAEAEARAARAKARSKAKPAAKKGGIKKDDKSKTVKAKDTKVTPSKGTTKAKAPQGKAPTKSKQKASPAKK